MRPTSIEEFQGQTHIIASGGPLSSFDTTELGSSQLPSILLYGPPGTGKTTLARILAQKSQRKLIEVSAINSTIKDLRSAIDLSIATIDKGGKASIVFIDEIHRFSKVQQESVLQAVETGQIVLIGATTENPMFALTSAIMSRVTLFRLVELDDTELVAILKRALVDERGLNGKFGASDAVLAEIARLAGGDARKALTLLETVAVTAGREGNTSLSSDLVKASMPNALARYDATGDQHYDIISAFIKSVRGSDPDAALHWLARMIEGGEDPRFIARRLVILAAEDIGLADPSALGLANSTMNVVAQIGMPEGRIPLASTTIYLALAPKSNTAYNAINAALADVREGFTPSVPAHLRSSTIENDRIGYEYPHDLASGVSKQLYLPEGSIRRYYQPKSSGFESALLDRLAKLLKLRGKSAE
jgi:putative ATPase